MEFLQLQYFVALAHSQHLTRTADRMLVSPSAISASITRLENELGVKLFDRVGRNILLNSNGQLYLPYIEKALDLIAEGQQQLEVANSSSMKTLNVAMWNAIIYSRMVKDFRAIHPDIIFRYVFYDPAISRTYDTLKNLDFFISPTSSFQHPDWECEVFINDKVLLAVPPTHPLAEREEVAVSELANERFVFPTYGSWAQFNQHLCEQAGFKPRIRLECDTAMRPAAILEENAICFTTQTAVWSGIYSGCKILRIAPPFNNRPQAIFWRRDRKLSSIAQEFKSFVLQYYSQRVGNT